MIVFIIFSLFLKITLVHLAHVSQAKNVIKIEKPFYSWVMSQTNYLNTGIWNMKKKNNSRQTSPSKQNV